MKKFIIYITCFLFTFPALAQIDRTQYPEPGLAPEINIASAESFEMPNGLKVFVVENHKLPRVAFTLVFDRDPILEGNKAGMLELFGDMMMGGTEQYSKDELNQAIDQIGARISFGAGGASASSLTKYQEKLLELFNEILLRPTFPDVELDKAKKMKLSNLAYAKNDPGSISNVVSRAVLYGKDHPYGESASEETVGNLQVNDFKSFYNTYYRPNGAYLAIVGDITLKEAKRLVGKYFSDWKKGKVPSQEWEVPDAPESNQVILVDRPSSVQSVINVAYPLVYEQNSPDRIPVGLLSYILGGGSSSRLFLNLREDKGYTYGAYASINPDELVGEFSANASVRTEVTDSAIHEFFVEMNRLNEGTITETELNLAKAAIAGQFGRSLESPSTIANFAINIERYNLPEDYYKNYLKNVEGVKLEQLNRLAPKYIKPEHSYIIVVGNTSEFETGVDAYGVVRRFSVEGEPISAARDAGSVTSQELLEKYISAIGGRDKLNSVRSIKVVSSGEIQGMTLTQELVIDKSKEIAMQKTLMGPQELSKVLIKRDKVTASAMGREQELPDAAAKALKGTLDIFPELTYKERGVEATVDGIQTINGEEAYKVVIENDGATSTEYFSKSSGLKLRSESPVEGEVNYGLYKTYDGVKMPSEVRVNNPNMPVELKMVVSEVVINPELSDSDFQ